MKNCVICDAEFEPYRSSSIYCDKKCRKIGHADNKRKFTSKNRDRLNAERRQKYTEKYGIKSCQTCKQDIPYNGNNISYSRLKYCRHECRPCNDEEHMKVLRAKRARAKGTKPKRTFANEEERKVHKRQRTLNYYHNMTQEQRDRRNATRRKYRKRPEVREKERIQLQCWNKKNTHKKKEYYEKYRKNPMAVLRSRMSTALRNSLKYKGSKKKRPTFDLLDFTKQELREHLESHFTEENGYTWDNMEDWHIDHIRPVSSFNFTTTDCEDFKKCWALNNLQPLWAKDNLSKGDKWDGEVNA